MGDDKEPLNKTANRFEEVKTRKIRDFVTGLLYDLFTPITGTPEERHEGWSARLVKIASLLGYLHKDDEEELSILNDIDGYFDEKLGEIDTDVSDFTEKDRIIKLNTSGRQGGSSCVPESQESTIKSIREEQYNVLANKAKKLVYKATAQLKKEFAWYRPGFGMKKFTMEDDNGKST